MQLNFCIFWFVTTLFWLAGVDIGKRGMLVEAYEAIGNYHNDAYPGKCVITLPFILSPGEIRKSPTGCYDIHCVSANGDARFNGCGVEGLPDGCQWGDYINRNAPVPQCCRRHRICNGR